MKKRILCTLLCAVMLLCPLLLTGCGYDSAESLVEDYYKAMKSGTSGEAVYNAANLDVIYDILLENGVKDEDELISSKESYIASFDVSCAENRARYSDAFGEDWKFIVKEFYTDGLADTQISYYEENFEQCYGLEIEIDDGCDIWFKAAYVGENGSNTVHYEAVALKINGEWILADTLYTFVN